MTHMNIRFRLPGFILALMLLLGSSIGCSKVPDPPPEPFTAEELPGAVEKAFSTSKPEAKELADAFAASVRAKDIPKAFDQMQKLATQPNHSKEQSLAIARALLTMNTLLQEAQAAGDQKATKAMQNYRFNK
jgi:hypothetical protein